MQFFSQTYQLDNHRQLIDDLLQADTLFEFIDFLLGALPDSQVSDLFAAYPAFERFYGSTFCPVPDVPHDVDGVNPALGNLVSESPRATLFTTDDFPLDADMIGDLFILINSEIESDDDFFDNQTLLRIKQALIAIDNKLSETNTVQDTNDDYPEWVKV